MRIATVWIVAIAMSLALCGTGFGDEYSVIDLGHLAGWSDWSVARDIGADGQGNVVVVGESGLTGGASARGFRWTYPSGPPEELPPLPGYSRSVVTGANNRGQAAGFSNIGGRDQATLWDPYGAPLDLGDGTPFDINDCRQAVGHTGTRLGERPAYWTADLVRTQLPLPPSAIAGRAEGASDNCRWAVGGAWDDTAHGQACRWDLDLYRPNPDPSNQACLELLPDPPGGLDVTEALDINNAGQAVGLGELTFGPTGWRALLWDVDSNGTPLPAIDLGDLHGGTADYVAAYGMNNVCQVVGVSKLGTDVRALLWDSTNGMRDLNDLIDPNSGWILVGAYAINDAGWIVGMGINPEGNEHAFLLIPEPASATLGMLGLSVLAVLRRRRRLG